MTDVVPTRFLRVSVDGREQSRDLLRASGPAVPEGASRAERRAIVWTRRIAVVLPAGSHTVVITLLPRWVRALSPAMVAVAAALFLAVLGAGLQAWLPSRR